MAAYRDLLTQLLAEANDEEMLSFTESFFLSLCEVCVNIIQLQFKPLTSIESVVFPIPGIFATGYIPIVDLNLLQRTSDNSNLDNLMLLTIVRDSAAKEWLKNSGDLINYFSDGWSATGTPTEYYLIFSNLMGVRKSPTVDPTPSLTYVQYIEVIDIDSTILLKILLCL
jgi:hypothetical protein